MKFLTYFLHEHRLSTEKITIAFKYGNVRQLVIFGSKDFAIVF